MSESTPRALTEQQQSAVDTRGVSIVLSSGAGCGKTSVLTERYLSHLERDRCDVNQLIAITFTDKAAREMRQRIRRAVQARVATSKQEDCEYWKKQLQGLETATISTIHSFCTQLLRSHSLAAELDPAFDIMEESIAPNLRDKVVLESLHGLLIQDDNDGQALQELVRWYGWRIIRSAIEDLVREQDQLAWEAWLSQSKKEIANKWRVFAETDLFPQRHKELSETGPMAEILQLLCKIESPNSKFTENVTIITNEWAKLPHSANRDEVLDRIKETAKVQGVVKADSWKDASVFDQVKKAFENCRDAISKKFKPLFTIPDELESSAHFGQLFLRVASVCARNYQAEKRQRGYVDFQDLLVLTRDVLKNHVGVRHDCQRRYRFILVDELQDTDHIQMELVELLLGKDKNKGKLFAVGDAKQSIYRFRGAEVDEFERLREAVPKRGQQVLSTNFRSQPDVLNFVNAVLCRDIRQYEPLSASMAQVNPGPCVEFLWSDATGTAQENRRAEAKRIAQTIAAMVTKKEQIVTLRPTDGPGTLRAVQPGDIVLLFRAMTNVGIYEEALRDAGLDYYLVGGRAFFAQQEIYDVLNLLRTLENPHDLLSLAGVLRSPFGCVSDEGLYVLARHPNGLWKVLHDIRYNSRLPSHDRESVQRIGKWLLEWREVKDRLPIAGLINRAVADSGYDASLQFERLADRKLANLWKLIDMARTFDAAGSFRLADFIARLNDLVATPPHEEQAATQPEISNVVRLMSIHQAKGLEFPVVFLPDLNAAVEGSRGATAEWDRTLGCIARQPSDEDPPPFSDWPRQIWEAKECRAEREEALRVFYVACTRAMDYLALSASIDRPAKPANTPMSVLQSRFDLESGACLDRSIPDNQRPRVRVNRVIVNKAGLLKQRPITPKPLTSTDAANVRPIVV